MLLCFGNISHDTVTNLVSIYKGGGRGSQSKRKPSNHGKDEKDFGKR